MRGPVLLIVAAMVFVSTAKHEFKPADGRHDIFMGQRIDSPEDTLLFEDTQTMKAVWFLYPKVQSTQVCYPPLPSNTEVITITAFNVTDLVGGGNGGYAFVTDGGVGRANVCFHLKTQRRKGYNFYIRGWGTTTPIAEQDNDNFDQIN